MNGKKIGIIFTLLVGLLLAVSLFLDKEENQCNSQTENLINQRTELQIELVESFNRVYFVQTIMAVENYSEITTYGNDSLNQGIQFKINPELSNLSDNTLIQTEELESKIN